MLRANVISFILSQFLGLYSVIVAVIMFIRVRQYRELVQKMKPESGTLLLGGLFGLMVGLFLVGIHNIWVFKPIVYITVVCWAILLFSVLSLVSPDLLMVLMKKACSGSNYYVLASFLLMLGLIFLMTGLYLYAIHENSFLFLRLKL